MAPTYSEMFPNPNTPQATSCYLAWGNMRKLMFGVDGSRNLSLYELGISHGARRGGLSSGVSVWYGCRSDGNRQHQGGESDGCPRSLQMSFPISRSSYSNIFKHKQTNHRFRSLGDFGPSLFDSRQSRSGLTKGY